MAHVIIIEGTGLKVKGYYSDDANTIEKSEDFKNLQNELKKLNLLSIGLTSDEEELTDFVIGKELLKERYISKGETAFISNDIKNLTNTDIENINIYYKKLLEIVKKENIVIISEREGLYINYFD